MARARKPHDTAPEDTAGDLVAENARLLLEVQRLRLECKGLRHDNVTATRERDTLLKENIALRQGGHSDVTALRQQLKTSESERRLAERYIAVLEHQCTRLRLELQDAAHAAQPHGAMVPTREIARQLRDLIGFCHPDKWQGAAVATELVKHLNALRAQYTTRGVRSRLDA